MSKHAKKKAFPVKGLLRGVIALVAVAAVLLGGVWVVQWGGAGTVSALFERVTALWLPAAETSKDSQTTVPNVTEPTQLNASDSSQPEEEPVVDPVTEEPVFARPGEMHGVWLTPGVEYLLTDKESGETVKKQIDAAFATIKQYKFNTLLLPVRKGDKVLYPSEQSRQLLIRNADGSAFDPLAYALKLARDNGMFVYGVLDLRVSETGGADPSVAAEADKLVAEVGEAVSTYATDGWLVEDYSYATGKTGSYAAYMQQAPGSGLEAFTRARLDATVKAVADTIKAQNRDLYVGLLSGAVWAHKAADARGSATSGVYEELTDGHADTRAWLENGWFDFVMVKNYASLTNSGAGFNTVLKWWTELCAAQKLPLYMAHASEKVGGKESGWASPDQLSRQLVACQGSTAWAGSAFSSLAALKRHAESTAALLKVFEGSILAQYLSDTLTFTAPAKTTFSTTESKLSFSGGADPNFSLTMNGKAVALTKHGFFAADVTLTPGKNTFTFVHKGKTVVYTVTYVVDVLKSVTPADKQELDGDSVLVVTAIARKGAKVEATFNKKKLTMKASPIQAEDAAGEDLSDYERYTASFTLPKGVVNKAQALGTATVSSSFNGLNKTLQSGAVTVKALPVVDAPEIELPGVLNKLTPINPNQSGAVLKTGTVVIVNEDYIETFSGATSDDYSRPTNAYLPKGTTDVIVRSVYGPASYYLLGCGRRVYQSDVVKYIENGKLTENRLKSAAMVVGKSHTVLSFQSGWRVPYNVMLLPQQYQNASMTAQPSYSINKYGQTTAYVDVAFSYTTQVPVLPDVANSPLFEKAEWIKGTDTTYTLRLYLTKVGQFYGYSAVWDNAGVLHLSFKHPTTVADNSAAQKLKGVTIVLDPGHGQKSSGTYGTIPGLYEKTLTLEYGLLLRDKLQALGATVVMSRTTDQSPDLVVNGKYVMTPRTDLARNNKIDLFISIHMNGVSGQSASGCSIHYFNEYSYAIARKMTDAMRAVEKSYSIGNRSQPCAWSPFMVTRLHDCPSILIECGFMTNPDNMELLVNTTYKNKLVQAMSDAVVQYFTALPKLSFTTTSTTTGSVASETGNGGTTASLPSATGEATAPAAAKAVAPGVPTAGSMAAAGVLFPSGVWHFINKRRTCGRHAA